ncbi:MAG: ParB/RepB/Spo0J family partition protein [Lachnospiraceae bacterium]
MAKFDLKGMLSERSTQEMDLPEQKTVYRNPEELIPSKDNFYSTEDTEKLKQSIKALGILQPLLIEERDGKDYILAGHSRRKCCLELIEEGMDRFRKIPCDTNLRSS